MIYNILRRNKMSQFEMLEGNKAKLTINVSAEEFEKAIGEFQSRDRRYGGRK